MWACVHMSYDNPYFISTLVEKLTLRSLKCLHNTRVLIRYRNSDNLHSRPSKVQCTMPTHSYLPIMGDILNVIKGCRPGTFQYLERHRWSMNTLSEVGPFRNKNSNCTLLHTIDIPHTPCIHYTIYSNKPVSLSWAGGHMELPWQMDHYNASNYTETHQTHRWFPLWLSPSTGYKIVVKRGPLFISKKIHLPSYVPVEIIQPFGRHHNHSKNLNSW